MILRLTLQVRYVLILLAQSVAIFLALTVAFLLRFDFSIPPGEMAGFRTALILVVVTKLLPFRMAQLHRGWTMHIGMRDLLGILAANLAGSTLFAIATFLIVGPQFPRSVYILDFLICFVTIAAMRSVARLRREWRGRRAGGQ